ncbi:hypothetical protein KHC23_14215 [Ancylobacter dichloromethanicus]|uniref:Uncharacterized protein n=1 Tax=Ancylobacter dichloromethanicus TaxID=518825 RepID=A0A9W6J9N7_9HYPH|nr:hypothetical protein [Ancylobacter dichloromethanicus]MBS7554804.1 hypothetical protein [Ancylobacter dichloromethanicus]GLK71869.1 hypothetical protein GCM10017643_19850 [Ancylobacter dichloromethanicus]
MTVAHTPSRRDLTPRDPTTHLFAIGQVVRLRGGYGVFTSRFGDIYQITGTLPPSGNSLQYRIRNEREQHERVATEDSLEAVRATEPGEGAALMDRTFGR